MPSLPCGAARRSRRGRTGDRPRRRTTARRASVSYPHRPIDDGATEVSAVADRDHERFNGNDVLKSDGGKDKTKGQRGRDSLQGGGGNDRLNDIVGFNKFKCGGGKDRVVSNLKSRRTIADDCETVKLMKNN